jgi:hypothetical protein
MSSLTCSLCPLFSSLSPSVIIMDYCDYGSLVRPILKGMFRPVSASGSDREARVRYRALLRTAKEIAQGLEHLHHLKVVHGGELVFQRARGAGLVCAGGGGWSRRRTVWMHHKVVKGGEFGGGGGGGGGGGCSSQLLVVDSPLS